MNQPTIELSDAELARTVLALVDDFRHRLAGRIDTIDAALADGSCRHAARELCRIVRDQKIGHSDDEHNTLRDIERYLYDTQGPRD